MKLEIEKIEVKKNLSSKIDEKLSLITELLSL